MPDQQFGEIDGYPEGSVFSDRMEIKNAGLHKYHINGISRVLGIGCDAIILNISDELVPITYTLHQNYPNPFNPTTSLRYDLPENNLVNITIYDMLGREVKALINQTQDAGYRSVIWDATNDYGKPVSAGIYLCQIQAGEFISTKKMVLLK